MDSYLSKEMLNGSWSEIRFYFIRCWNHWIDYLDGGNMRIEDENIECPECLGNGYDLDGPMGDDEMEDCCVCGGTGTTTGEDWYPRGH